MNFYRRAIFFFIIVFLNCCSKAQYEIIDTNSQMLLQLQKPREYVVGPGDVLNVSVWRVQELNRDVVVRPDGKISFPLVGDIHVVGLTVKEIKKELTKRLEEYIPQVTVSVAVTQINSQKIYILGEVNRPGEYDMVGNLDVLQALSMAGGFTDYAKKSKIIILRKIGNKKLKIKFNYNQVIKGKHLEQNIPLQRGDVILVP